MAICKVCSKEVKIDDVYCMNCGNKLIADTPAEVKQQIVRNSCSKKITLVLAFLLGPFGLHNWYLGQKTSFYVKFAVSLISYGLLVPIMWIWSVIEGINIMRNPNYKDAYGMPLRK